MPIPYRTDLERPLADFVAGHRGLRLTRTFGMPAAYAGRRMFACLIEDGVGCRLPVDAARRELARGAKPFPAREGPTRRGGGISGWVFYRPRRGAFTADVVRTLEEAARHAATLSVGSGRDRLVTGRGSTRRPTRRRRLEPSA